jgi:predicted DNA-binding WGR domain protein
MKRRFEFVEGNSAKFWEISISGADVTVTFGRLGTDGQTQTKTLADTEAAAKHTDKLIAEKTKKGYHEIAATT